MSFCNDDLPAYTRADFLASLKLESLCGQYKGQTRCIQDRLFHVQLVEPYVASPDSDMLIVTNNNTVLEEVWI